jgi:3-methylcrotonyl-CoA carboxylase alpha subunit
MFRRVLVANRGEIAVRVIRACRELGIATAAVYSEADAQAMHVRLADDARCLGPAAPRESYLDAGRVLDAARVMGCDAVHPGYGFLSENADFAQAVQDAGLAWIGPPPAAIRAMGLKVEARALAQQAGVPVGPGFSPVGTGPAPSATDGEEEVGGGRGQPRPEAWAPVRGLADRAGPVPTWEDAAAALGYPVLVKASAGGGGKGMRVVQSAADLPAALAAARREAQAAFGDGRVYLEKYLVRPRHIEIQVLADAHGNCIHLGERECSIQRRHQKVLEESPSPFVTPELRAEMGACAVRLAQAVGYVGAGTLEFMVEPDGSYYFLEMNTRLQVEHPVTEFVYGLDLVQWQLRIAAGASLVERGSTDPLPTPETEEGDAALKSRAPRDEDAALKSRAPGIPADRAGPVPTGRGHAIEVRLCAEDPAAGFLPQTGRVAVYREPAGPGVRVDSALYAGWEVGADYDPLLAKLVCYGEDRAQAIARLRTALADYRILGLTTNLDFLRALAAHPAFAAGETDTGFIAQHFAGWQPPAADLPAQLAAALAIATERGRAESGATGIRGEAGSADSPWQSLGAWSNVRAGAGGTGDE